MSDVPDHRTIPIGEAGLHQETGGQDWVLYYGFVAIGVLMNPVHQLFGTSDVV